MAKTMFRKNPYSIQSASLVLHNGALRRWWCWLPRVVVLGATAYALCSFLWSSQSIGGFATPFTRSHQVENTRPQSSIYPLPLPSDETASRNLRCIAWRNTQGCNPEGPREPEMDQNCTVIVSNGESGYCEVEDIDSGERFQVMRRHCNSIRRGVPFRCSDAHEFVQFRVQAYKTARAAFEANFTLPNVAVANQPRNGIVMVVYPKLLASAYATIRVLRDVLGCQLPVEIWFRPDEMKLDGQILAPLRLLASSDSSITFQEIHDPRAKRFVAKVHAIYHSSFDRVLFLDADNVPVRDPSFLFDSPAFLRTGAIFWPDFWHPRSTIFNIHESSLLWELLGMESVDMFEQESGQLVVDRRRHAAPLELVRYFAFHRPDFFSSLRLAWGDKDLFRFAWLKLEIPFYMIQTPPAMAGSIVETAVQSEFCGMTMVQHDAEGEVLFLHRNHQKLTGKSDSTQDHDDFGSLSAALDSDRYPDPVVWTHLLRFRKGSAMKDYVVQSFSVEFTFKKKQTCFGRLDIRHSPDFYVQDVKSLAFNGLETHLRRFAMDSINLSGET